MTVPSGYSVTVVDADGRVKGKHVPNAETAYAWCRYFERQGLATGICAASLGLACAASEARRADASAADLAAFYAERPVRRAQRIASGWKPYLRGRWPEWAGLLFGFPLPGERRAR